MLAGTAVCPNPQLINCNSAICADASCMATRSGLSLRFAWPLISRPLFVFESSDSSGFSKCEYRIFSAKVNWRDDPSTRRTSLRRARSLGYGGVREATSTLRAEGRSWDVARFRRGEVWRDKRLRRGCHCSQYGSCCGVHEVRCNGQV